MFPLRGLLTPYTGGDNPLAAACIPGEGRWQAPRGAQLGGNCHQLSPPQVILRAVAGSRILMRVIATPSKARRVGTATNPQG